MEYIAEIEVMPKKEILDPQGKAVKLGLENLGIHQVGEVRVGKHIRLQVEAEDEAKAQQIVEEACQKLLANLIMEDFRIALKAAV